MKKNYKTLNEEINRIKSLFSESRLYGNLVEKNIISEQKKFFSNLTDAFKVTLKSFDDLNTFNKFINKDISTVDDIIDHVDEFEDMWKLVSKNLNTTKLRSNLQKLKTIIDSGKLKNIPEDKMKIALKGFPKEGGMQEMIFDLWLESKGMSSNLPQKVETRLVKTNPSTGELVIGTVNQKGMVTYKNERGEVVLIEKDPNAKTDDADIETDELKSDIEDVEWVDVSENTPLGDLDGKTVKGDKENIENFNDTLNDEIKEANSEGNEFYLNIEIKGEGAQEFADKLLNKEYFKSKDEVIEDSVNKSMEDIKETDPAKRKKIRLNLFNLYKKLFGEWDTRLVLNPTTFMPGVGSGKGIFNFEQFPDANMWSKRRGPQIILRTLIYTPLTAEAIYALTDDWFNEPGMPNRKVYDKNDMSNNILIHWIDDLTYWLGRQKVAKKASELTLAAIEKTIINLTNGKVQPLPIKQKITTAVEDDLKKLILDEQGKFDETKCPKLGKSNSEIISKIFKKASDKEIADVITKTQNLGYDVREVETIEETVTNYLTKFGELDILESDNYKEIIESARRKCKEFQDQMKTIEEESKKMETEEYTVEIDSGMVNI